jgi:prolyl-tRNA editing enzyme YbaK/EbsC (Cys-tRNA(Pro) deacylase)
VSEATTDRVAAFIVSHRLDAEIIPTPDGVPTVERAAAALNVDPDQIIKTLVFTDAQDRLVIAIACGTGRVDRSKLADAAGSGKLKFAPAPVVVDTTGYPPGGVAPVDLPNDAIVIVDEQVTVQPVVYGGSGTDLHMMRVRVEDVIRLNNATTADILQNPAS